MQKRGSLKVVPDNIGASSSCPMPQGPQSQTISVRPAPCPRDLKLSVCSHTYLRCRSLFRIMFTQLFKEIKDFFVIISGNRL